MPRGPEEDRGMKIILAILVIAVLAYLGYRMFFVNAHKK